MYAEAVVEGMVVKVMQRDTQRKNGKESRNKTQELPHLTNDNTMEKSH